MFSNLRSMSQPMVGNSVLYVLMWLMKLRK